MNRKNQIKKVKNQGFTLIEILVVIGIIAILATVVLIAINPARQFAQARNSQRVSNINTILNAVGQKLADCRGKFDATSAECPTSPVCPSLVAGPATICAGSSCSAGTTIDFACLTPTYIASQIPLDPTAGAWTSATDYNSGYTIAYNSTTGRITVVAPAGSPSGSDTTAAALGQTISVTR